MCMCADEGTVWSKRGKGQRGRVSNGVRGRYSGSNNTLSYVGEARCVGNCQEFGLIRPLDL